MYLVKTGLIAIQNIEKTSCELIADDTLACTSHAETSGVDGLRFGRDPVDLKLTVCFKEVGAGAAPAMLECQVCIVAWNSDRRSQREAADALAEAKPPGADAGESAHKDDEYDGFHWDLLLIFYV